MKLKGTDPRLVNEYGSGMRYSFRIEEESAGAAKRSIDEYREGYISVDVSRWREHRSIEANAYAWKLLQLMADYFTLRGAATSKDDMYDQELRKYGQTGVVKIAPSQTESILRSFRIYEPHEKLYEESAKYYRVWVGSSHYNTEEMSAFINGIIEDAKELGIETLPPDEVKRMMERYDKEAST